VTAPAATPTSGDYVSAMTTVRLGVLGALLLPTLALGQANQGYPPRPAQAAPATPQSAGDAGAAQPSPGGTQQQQAQRQQGQAESAAQPSGAPEDATAAQIAAISEASRADRAQLRQQITALQSEVNTLTAELAASREQALRMEQELLRLRAERAAQEQQARESSAAVQQSTQDLAQAQRELAAGAVTEPDLERARAALAETDPASPRGVHAREASRLIDAAMDAIRRDSLYEARVLLQQASAQAQAARAAQGGVR
jgi:hypothetical protein